jgi:Ricin-type beta-trefoil lectin domain
LSDRHADAQGPEVGASTQNWTVNSNGTIVNGSGLCLSVSGGSTAPGATADVYTCNGSASEFWTV